MEKKGNLLRSWKDISAFLGVNPKTCRRWEIEQKLPIHRINPDSHRSPVFAYVSELEAWLAAKPLLSGSPSKGDIKRRIRKRIHIWGSTALAALFCAAALYLAFPRASDMGARDGLAIAVTPFEDLDRSPQNAYFSEGITHEIITDLASYSRVRAFAAAGPADPLAASWSPNRGGSAVRADYLLRGGVRRQSGIIHLNFEVVRMRDRARILRLNLEESLDKPFTIVDSVCRKISETLQLGRQAGLEEGRPGAMAAPSFAAFDAYLKGNYAADRYELREDTDSWQLFNQGKYYSSQSSREGNDLAIQLFNQAVGADGRFAQAYIGLAYCFSNYVNYGWDVQMTWLDKAEELLAKAQSITPDLPEYFSCRTEINLTRFVHSGLDPKPRDIAFATAEEGIRRYPTFPLLLSIAGYCHFMKFGETGLEEHFQKALECKRRSFASNPYAFGNIVYTEFLMLAGDFANAVSVCEIVRKHDPDNMALCRLGEIYYYSGDMEKSRAIMEQVNGPGLVQKIWALRFLAMIAARRGEEAEARRLRDEIITLSPPEAPLPMAILKMASIALGIGERKEGLRLLDQFFSDPRTQITPYIFRRYVDMDRNFDLYRNDPEFRSVIEKGMKPWPQASPSGSRPTSKSALTN